MRGLVFEPLEEASQKNETSFSTLSAFVGLILAPLGCLEAQPQ